MRACLLTEALYTWWWRPARESGGDECEAAATDVHAQFLGIGAEFTQELRLDNQLRQTLVVLRVLSEPQSKGPEGEEGKGGQVG